MSALSEFKDKVVIVTGASSGIGAGVAVEYARHGARLVLAGRNKINLQKTGEKCQQEGLSKDKILLVIGDLTNEEDCNDLVDQAVEQFGKIDILINNAGGLVTGRMDKCTAADMTFMYKTNVLSTFMVSKGAIPHLIKTKGSLLNVSSIAGIRPYPSGTAYGAAKAAVTHLTSIMAQDLAPSGVNVNCITPGVVITPIMTRPGSILADAPENLPQFVKKIAKLHPLGRVGNVEEVAGTILFLTSQAASFITGAVLPIDGGRHGTSSKL